MQLTASTRFFLPQSNLLAGDAAMFIMLVPQSSENGRYVFRIFAKIFRASFEFIFKSYGFCENKNLIFNSISFCV